MLDESYNANPASVGAALALVGSLKAERRIAVLGDMLELGPLGPSLHAALAEDILTHRIDVVFAAGPLMKNLFNALPQDRRGAWCESAASLEDIVLAAVSAGDLVIVKGSNASKMSAIVAALKTRYSGETASP
ncbi:MAG: hypothetical protein WDN29_09440 [Methylovirgula sp.]